jgi:hypothetical protein
MVLMLKGKIAPLAITLFLPEAAKHFQVLPEYSPHLREILRIERGARQSCVWARMTKAASTMRHQ